MPPPADSGFATKASAATIAGPGSSVLDPGIPVVPTLAKVAFDRDTGNGSGMAPKGMESLLALAFSTQRTIGTKTHSAGREASHSSHGDRERPVRTKTCPGGAGKIGHSWSPPGLSRSTCEASIAERPSPNPQPGHHIDPYPVQIAPGQCHRGTLG